MAVSAANREHRMPFLLTKKGIRRGRKASDEVSTTALERWLVDLVFAWLE